MDFDKVSPKSMEYLAKVAESPENFKELTMAFIAQQEATALRVPDFKAEYEWINTSEKLSYQTNLKDKLCILDFFTYCCINCMHILPQLHELEEKHSIEDGVVVIGIHSAKFQNEKVLSNILSAVLRYDINHPVVNDVNAELWNAMSVRCWPTFVIVSPDGCPLLYLVGEGHKEVLFKFVDLALGYYKSKDRISAAPVPIKLAKDNLDSGLLKYPGKLSLNSNGSKIALSDTGNHRVLVYNDSGIISTIIGSGVQGMKDGLFQDAQLNSPQGLAWVDDCLFIADTENHAIRKAELSSGMLVTVVGTGRQGEDKEGGKLGTEQEISSPWDVLVTSAPGEDQESGKLNCLYIAAAGTHQIWSYFLEDGSWLKKGSQTRGTCLRFAGSGNEENRNNSYPHKACFAQPSHLTLGKVKDQNTIFVADSESSSIRTVDLKTGAVKACVGAERDPMNLFAYGDVDGKSVDAKLQHPLAVEYNKHDGLVYVADSYNHKIKVVDPKNNTCTTLTTKNEAGYKDGPFSVCQFNEPGGLSVSTDGLLLYVADTNNHQVRLIDLKEKQVKTLTLIKDDIDSPPALSPNYRNLVTPSSSNTVQLEAISRDLSCGSIDVIVDINLKGQLHFTGDVESKWQISCSELNSIGNQPMNFENGKVNKTTGKIETRLVVRDAFESVTVQVELLLFVCIGELCIMKQYVVRQLIKNDQTTGTEKVPIVQNVEE